MSRNKKKLGQRLQYKFDNYIIEILAQKMIMLCVS